jgi:cytoskeletal protein RodZ
MQSFGSYLKERRESKNVSLKDICRTTKITQRYLDFIEKDEFKKVPGGAYIRGYISSYASFIGMDARETLERFDSFRREKYETEYKQDELAREKAKRNPIMFLSNKGKWVIICSSILIFMTLGAINLLSRDDKQALIVADFHSDNGEELKINDEITSKDRMPLETTSYAMSHDEIENIPKEIEYIDSKRSQKDSLLSSRNREAKKPLKSTVLTPLPSGHLSEGQEISKPKTLTAASRKQTRQDTSNPEDYMKVLKTAVCTDVKGKNPSGKASSVQWTTDRVYVWNLIECEPGLSSIRHIYYFEGKRVSDIALDIRSSRWRTWSYKALSDQRFKGTWRVDITSADGKLLDSVQFEVS